MLNIYIFFKNNQRFFIAALFIILTYWFIYEIWAILPPFLIGIIFAYFLHPIHKKLVQYKIPNGIASLLLVLIMVGILLLFILIFVPWFVQQISQFYQGMNDYIFVFFQSIESLAKTYHLETIIPDIHKLSTYSSQISSFLLPVAQYIFAQLTSWMSTIGLLIITPLMTYYFLQDWKKLLYYIGNTIHIQQFPLFIFILKKINTKLKRYLWSIMLDSTILSVYYSIAFGIMGVPFFILLGILSGILNIFPYVGPFASFIFAILLVYNTWHSLGYFLITCGIYFVGYIIDGYILQPYVIGKNIGITPGIVLFSVMAGGSLYGLTGILLALPVAAIMSIILPVWIQYIVNGTVDI